MRYTVFLHPKAQEFLEVCDPNLRKRVENRLRELARNPGRQGRRLSPSPFRRLRIGKYRAIFEIDGKDNRVIVLFIGHRDAVYDDFSRIF